MPSAHDRAGAPRHAAVHPRGHAPPGTDPAARRAVRRAPRSYVLLAATGLTALAGYVNTSVLTFFAVPVSHVTGAVSRLGLDLVDGRTADLVAVVGIVVGFFVGAMLSGVVVGGTEVRVGRRYGVALVGEGVLLGLAAVLLGGTGARAGVVVAAMACGLQNGLASHYRGLVLRTTHLTGIVTDLGVLAGHRVRGARVPAWKARFLASLVAGFLGGSLGGAWATPRYGADALWAGALFCIGAGSVYAAYRHRLGGARRMA